MTARRPIRPLLSVPFVIGAITLIATAIGLQPAVAALIRAFSKEPIDLRRALATIDLSRVPSF